MTAEEAELDRIISEVTDLWDEPLDEVHDVPKIRNAILAAGYRKLLPTAALHGD